MEIYFKDSGGSRVGFIIGTDIKDNSGSRVGYIEGDSIKDNSGSRVGYIEGSSFKNNYGIRVGYIEGNNIKDTYGTRVGYPESTASNIEMCAAGFLLFGLEAQSSQQQTYSRPQRKKPEGFLEWAGFILAWLFYPYYENIKYFKYAATRREWWGTFGRMFLLAMLLTLIGLGSLKYGPLIVYIIMFIPITLASIRRMRDLGKAWWWILIPVYGFILCGFIRGKE